MLSIGVDAVDIVRFEHWQYYTTVTLQRVFSATEIAYCLQEPIKSAERFAVRFAAKEALFKALTLAGITMPPLLQLCKHSQFLFSSHYPHLHVNWKELAIPFYVVSCSVSHTKTTAIAVVLLQRT